MLNSDFIGKSVTLTYPNGAVRVGKVVRKGRALWVECPEGSIRFGYYNSADGGENINGFRFTVKDNNSNA